MRSRALILACAPLLMAVQCATTREPEIRTVEVRVPVAVSCVPEGTPTETPARADVSGETGSVIQAITAELIQWRGYGAQVAPVLAACRRAGEPSQP